ncbi:MAG: 1,2-phenylacetyl-CoA epoxidase subunit B [Chitinophagales bacterium]
MKSLDPRINRLELPHEANVGENEYWCTFEVFKQSKRGKHHEHVGSVHAPDPEMALVFAKEQFGRRIACVNMWVVKSSEVFAFRTEDEDMFENIPDKQHREAGIYKVRDRIQAFKTASAKEK